jgi:hypothetical protein
VYLFLTSSPAKSSDASTRSAHFDVTPLPGGGAATVGGAF